ncbi:MAG: peptide chain release factor N(5)-glutamine methyltransferase [Rhodovibrionaceae bacterium]
MPRLAEVERAAAERLAVAGVESPRRDVRLLLAASLGLDAGAVLAERGCELSAAQQADFARLLDRRLAREPVSRILGRREFWSLDFAISPATLDPRPESETLIEILLESLSQRAVAYRVLDLGTGSGCLLLALLCELPAASGLGVDRSPDALRTAAENAARLGLADRAAFQAGDWGAGLEPGFDLLLCNPPYIAETEWPALAPEVADYDPRDALLAGPDGLAAYAEIAPQAYRLLAPGGLAAFEIGASQEQAVTALLTDSGLRWRETRRDLAGHPRALLFGKPEL